MEKRNITRREFIKANAVATVAGTTLLLGGEAFAPNRCEAELDDLEIMQEPPHISCVDYLKALQKKS